MGFDFESYLGAVERSVASLERDGRPARAITLSRSYPTTACDLWDAVTNGERIPRWFLPIQGKLEPGGRFQFEGNAGGAITACEPPARLALTWEFGGDVSWVEVRIADDGAGGARLVPSPTPRSFPSTGTGTGPGRPASAGRAASWGWRCTSRSRPRRSWTKPRSPLPAMARRSTPAPARRGEKRPSRPERIPARRAPRRRARPRSTPGNRPDARVRGAPRSGAAAHPRAPG